MGSEMAVAGSTLNITRPRQRRNRKPGAVIAGTDRHGIGVSSGSRNDRAARSGQDVVVDVHLAVVVAVGPIGVALGVIAGLAVRAIAAVRVVWLELPAASAAASESGLGAAGSQELGAGQVGEKIAERGFQAVLPGLKLHQAVGVHGRSKCKGLLKQPTTPEGWASIAKIVQKGGVYECMWSEMDPVTFRKLVDPMQQVLQRRLDLSMSRELLPNQ